MNAEPAVDIRMLQRDTEEWIRRCFPGATLPEERGLRALEEMIELAQAMGVDRGQAHRLVDYVFDRPVGEIGQEIGGVALTLSAVASTVDIDLGSCWQTELDRVNDRIEQVREKQKFKATQGIVAKPKSDTPTCPHRGCSRRLGDPCDYAMCPQRIAPVDKRFTPEKLQLVIEKLRLAGFADEDIAWSEHTEPPPTPEHFASEAIFVICNSGMHNRTAKLIFDRVFEAIRAQEPVFKALAHKAKASAIETIWRDRQALFDGYFAAQDKLKFCGDLPCLGPITKYHLAKNLGIDVAKPDRHLVRLAALDHETAQALCDRLGRATGLKSCTVDILLWRACANGILDPKTGEVRP